MAGEQADALIAQVAHRVGSPGRDAQRLIREHMAKAPFLSHASAVEHVAKRIWQHQWHDSVTPEEYVGDLHAAVRSALQLGVYVRRGGTLAVAVAPTEQAVHPSRVGAESRRLLVVIYSADRGRLISGYQVADLTEISLPEDVVWLQ